eukprot:Amastigsp_a846557_13.p3 type:complete len:148 gc:universal Amastigsp_a846557_13:519-76(-)
MATASALLARLAMRRHGQRPHSAGRSLPLVQAPKRLENIERSCKALHPLLNVVLAMAGHEPQHALLGLVNPKPIEPLHASVARRSADMQRPVGQGLLELDERCRRRALRCRRRARARVRVRVACALRGGLQLVRFLLPRVQPLLLHL